MEQDKDIKQFYKNLETIEYLTPDTNEFYVPLYERKIEKIRLKLLWGNVENKTIYVSGQTGSGKTTALNFLPNDEIHEQFVVEYFYANDVLELNNIDIVDILLMLCYRLVGDYEDLKLLLGERIIELGERLKGNLEKSIQTSKSHQGGLHMGILQQFSTIFGTQFNAGADYGFNREKKEVTRQVLRPQLKELLSLVNEIIQKYLDRKAPDTQKQLLIFFHDLNHMKNPVSIRGLFIDNLHYLESINAASIITIPVGLRALPLFSPEVTFLGLKTQKNPNTPENDTENQSIERNKNLLKAVIQKRIPAEKDLIEAKALDKAITYSGGIIRQLIDILLQATLEAKVNEDTYIYEHHVTNSLSNVREKLTRSLMLKGRIELLDFIRQNHSSDSGNEDLFIESAAANQIIEYRNDDIWYDINPLIENTVKTYAANLADKGE